MYSDESIISDKITPCGDCCHHDHNKRLSVVVSNYLFTILNICIIVCRCILYLVQIFRNDQNTVLKENIGIFKPKMHDNLFSKEFYFYFISIFIDRRKGNSSKETLLFDKNVNLIFNLSRTCFYLHFC